METHFNPVDPTGSNKGYEVPSILTDPESRHTNQLRKRYLKKAKTTFVDEKGNPIPGVEARTEQGDSDTPLTKRR